ncbi:hypothetical protein Tco_1333550, partial [Tanacetum coccineum]
GENVIPSVTKEPPSHTKGEHVAMEDDTEKPESDKAEEEPKHPRIDKGKKIATDDVESQVKLVPISKVAREDLDELDRELIKKAADQARLLAITKPEVVKVVRKEAEKFGIDPERITSAKC